MVLGREPIETSAVMTSFQVALETGDLDAIRRVPKSDLHNHFFLGGNRALVTSSGKERDSSCGVWKAECNWSLKWALSGPKIIFVPSTWPSAGLHARGKESVVGGQTFAPKRGRSFRRGLTEEELPRSRA